jgi:monovalent cation:proton antiporter-2 (CPA2) family protein
MTFLAEALVFLSAALVVVPVCKRLGLSAVLGYLAAGVLIGPHGFALIGGDPDDLLHFAEIGVVLLLFIIGLEIQPRRLWVMRKAVFGLGVAQVAVTALAIAVVVGVATDFGWPASWVIGFAMALSSTAFVLQLLAERHTLNRADGRAAFGVLLFQDIAVIPAIAIVALAGSGAAESTTIEPLWLGAAVLGIVAARFGLRPVLRFVAATGITELFAAASLALVVGAALAMNAVGLSMGLGAFIAGMLVADSEYRHQLETDVTPFKGLLLGLFFMAVGIATNIDLLVAEPLVIAGAVGMLVVSTGLIVLPLARWHGLTMTDSLRTAVVLSQGGEFAFVLLTAGASSALISPELADRAILVVTLSMVTTPLLVSLLERLLESDDEAQRPFDVIEEVDRSVVIAGFGRFGQIVARILTVEGIPFTAIERDPDQVEFVRQFGNEVYFGDSTRLDLLVLTIDDAEQSLKTATVVRRAFPNVRILARAHNRHHELRLRELGVDWVIRATLMSSLEMARELLVTVGASAEQASRSIDRFRDHDRGVLARQSAIFEDDKAYRQTTQEALEELKQIVADDKAGS